MADPVWQPLLREIIVKQMTNFMIVVSSEDFRVEFDVLSRIYVRLNPRYENKVLTIGQELTGAPACVRQTL